MMEEEKIDEFPFEREKYFIPSLQNPFALLDKAKALNDYLSDLTDINSCDPKLLRTIFLQATDKELLDQIQDNHSFRLLLSCSLIEIARLLGKQDQVFRKKKSLIVFKTIIDTLNNSEKLTERDHLIQYYYLLDLIETSNSLSLLVEEDTQKLSIEMIKALFAISHLAEKEPEISSKIQRLVKSLIKDLYDKANEGELQACFEVIMRNLKKEYRTTERRNLAKELLKDMSWSLKNFLGKYCVEIFKKRKRLPQSLSEDEFLYVIKQIFKTEDEILTDLIPNIENELLLTSKTESKKTLLQLIGKICTFKGSEISIKYWHLFRTFCEALTSKKNSQFRIDLIRMGFKYLRNFLQYARTSTGEDQLQPSTSSHRANGYHKNHIYLLSKLQEALLNSDTPVQLYVLSMVQEHAIWNPDVFGKDFLKEVTNLFLSKEQAVRTESIKVLASIYKHYCTSLFVDEIYELEEQKLEELSENQRRASITSKREIAKRFLWIADSIISLIYLYRSSSLIDIINGFGIMLNAKETEPINRARAFFGMFYNIYCDSFKEETLAETPGGSYAEFADKILRYRWIADKKLNSLPWKYKIEALRLILRRSSKFSKAVLKYLKGEHDFDQTAKSLAIKRIEKYCGRSGAFDCKKVLDELAFKFEDLQFQGKALRIIENKFSNEELVPNAIAEVHTRLEGPHTELFEAVRFDFCSPGAAEAMMKVLRTCVFKQYRANMYYQQAALRLMILFSELKHGEYYSNALNHDAPIIEIDGPDLFEKIVASRQSPNWIIQSKNFELLLKIHSKCKNSMRQSSRQSGLKFSQFLTKQILDGEFSSKQMKYAAKIMLNLNDAQNIKSLEKFCLSNLELKNSNLYPALVVLHEITKANAEFYSNNYQKLIKLFSQLLETGPSQSKEEIISEVSMCKKQLLATHHKCLFNEAPFFGMKEDMLERRKHLFNLSVQILLNSSGMGPGLSKDNQDYVRLYAMKYIFRLSEETFSQNEEGFFNEEFYAKLSLIALDENELVRKVLAARIIEAVSKGGRKIDDKYIVFLFFNVLDAKKELQELQENYLKACFNNPKAKTRRSGGNSRDYLSVSLQEVRAFPELCVVYLIFLLYNNPLFHDEEELISLAGFRVFDCYFALLSKNEDAGRIGPGIVQILILLKHYLPIAYKECLNSSISMLNVRGQSQGRVKTVKSTQIKPSVEKVEKFINYLKKMALAAFKLKESNIPHTPTLSFEIPASMFVLAEGLTENRASKPRKSRGKSAASPSRKLEENFERVRDNRTPSPKAKTPRTKSKSPRTGNKSPHEPKEGKSRKTTPKRMLYTQVMNENDEESVLEKLEEVKLEKHSSSRKKVSRKPKAAKGDDEGDEKRVKIIDLATVRETRSITKWRESQAAEQSQIKEAANESNAAGKGRRGRKKKRDEDDYAEHPVLKNPKVAKTKKKK